MNSIQTIALQLMLDMMRKQDIRFLNVIYKKKENRQTHQPSRNNREFFIIFHNLYTYSSLYNQLDRMLSRLVVRLVVQPQSLPAPLLGPLEKQCIRAYFHYDTHPFLVFGCKANYPNSFVKLCIRAMIIHQSQVGPNHRNLLPSNQCHINRRLVMDHQMAEAFTAIMTSATDLMIGGHAWNAHERWQ